VDPYEMRAPVHQCHGQHPPGIDELHTMPRIECASLDRGFCLCSCSSCAQGNHRQHKTHVTDCHVGCGWT
jgi:hypothetical protein